MNSTIFTGSAGEHFVLSQLLMKGFEAYLAIKDNQKDYDITVILKNNSVKRIQVKTTVLQSQSTNNSVKGTNKKYDYLILVVVDNGKISSYIMTHEEVEKLRGSHVELSVAQRSNDSKTVKPAFAQYLEKWNSIESVD